MMKEGREDENPVPRLRTQQTVRWSILTPLKYVLPRKASSSKLVCPLSHHAGRETRRACRREVLELAKGGLHG